jgi:proteasome lid subunit RPN8/RPN11
MVDGLMDLRIPRLLMRDIQHHGEQQYPEEGAGVLLGTQDEKSGRHVREILPFDNQFEAGQRGHRYLISPENMMWAEDLADEKGLDLIGIFHSHPDHPPRPSEFDLQWALPWYSYLITSVIDGDAGESRAWQLAEDRGGMTEQNIKVLESQAEGGS